MKLISCLATLACFLGSAQAAQYALDYPMVDVHTKAGLDIITDQCRPDFQVIHVVTSERRGDKKVPVTSITQCVPKTGDNVLGIFCNYGNNTCQTAPISQSVNELKAALSKGKGTPNK